MVRHMTGQFNLRKNILIQSAPVLFGLKTGSTFTLRDKQTEELRGFMGGWPVCLEELTDGGDSRVFLVYQGNMLTEKLMAPEHQDFLSEFGYFNFDKESGLRMLKLRFRRFKEGKGEFPHEIGIFLGYPLQDIRQFLLNNGRNYLLCGYWKVYVEPETAIHSFRIYDRAKELAACSLYL